MEISKLHLKYIDAVLVGTRKVLAYSHVCTL